MTSAMASRVARYACSEWRLNHDVSSTTTGNDSRATSASGQSSTSMIPPMVTMDRAAITRLCTPSSSRSFSASMSEVRREITRPDV